MPLQIDVIQDVCRSIALNMRDYSKTLHLSFIVHHAGQKLESLSLAGQELLGHPACEPAIRIMRENNKGEVSDFMGLAIWNESVLMGLSSRQHAMALTTINIDQFETQQEVRAQAWHMAWHAIWHFQQKDVPEFQAAFNERMVCPAYTESLQPTANMRADVFSAIMCRLHGNTDATGMIARGRCHDALSRNHKNTPEDYPFPLAYETTNAAINEMLRRPSSKKLQIHTALSVAEKVVEAYEEEISRQWIHFCKPAQDMAWRGYNEEMILGAAICTSHNTFSRTTGFLVSDILHIKPAGLVELEGHHSPFADDKYTERQHESMIERAFERAANAGVNEYSAAPFIKEANEQNQHLREGHIFGWCASALQAAGKIFEQAITEGRKTALEEARQEFDLFRQRSSWKDIKQLGETIIEQYRHGYAVTFSDIIEFCNGSPALAGISSSIVFTMKDPSYLKSLQIANDTAAHISTVFQPKAAFKSAPATPALASKPHHAPSPGLGSSGRATTAPAAPPQPVFELEDDSQH